ncbi:hypothetical protein GQ53DRAFT_743382 [Thozetella sp. PMI_491]|nr:hypothetical protein GQ53DRAFT_743382 [Thozetella sp. PMI_491]
MADTTPNLTAPAEPDWNDPPFLSMPEDIAYIGESSVAPKPPSRIARRLGLDVDRRLTCLTCNVKFISRNYLFHHLDWTGHAVNLATGEPETYSRYGYARPRQMRENNSNGDAEVGRDETLAEDIPQDLDMADSNDRELTNGEQFDDQMADIEMSC